MNTFLAPLTVVQYYLSFSPLSLQTFYSQVSSPLLRRITIQFPEDSVSDVTQNRFDKYFSGSELVVAGKVLPSESNTLTSFTTASAVSRAHNHTLKVVGEGKIRT